MTSYVLMYKGGRMISAIRSVRRVTGLSLADCHTVLKNPNGFILTQDNTDAVLRDYLVDDTDSLLANVLDWFIVEHNGRLPIDLREIHSVTPL